MLAMKASVAVGVCAAALTANAAPVELTSNGGFETGDISDWADFSFNTQTFGVTTDASVGAFAGEFFNDIEAQPGVFKQANIGVGVVVPGETITISFDAKGEAGIGGVHFAEFFSELDGGGVSATEILGGAPLFPPSDVYQSYSFTAVAGSDVSGGVTLQFSATTAAENGSFSRLFVDNVSVTVDRDVTALVGDYNSDGFVSQGDLDLVLLNWGDAVAPAGFNEGNLDGGGPFDGLVSQNELDGVLLNWGNGTPPATAAVPEPTGLALLGLGGLGLIARRRGH